MFNAYRFHAEQREYCKDLLREAERARLIQEALAYRHHRNIFYELFRIFSNLVWKS